MVMPRKSHRQPRRPRIKATIRVNDRQDYKADRISPGRLVAWAEWVPNSKEGKSNVK